SRARRPAGAEQISQRHQWGAAPNTEARAAAVRADRFHAPAALRLLPRPRLDRALGGAHDGVGGAGPATATHGDQSSVRLTAVAELHRIRTARAVGPPARGRL